MDRSSLTVLQKRLVELLRVTGHSTLRVSQIAAILGIDCDEDVQYETLRGLLASSRVVYYDEAAQTVRSTLTNHGDYEDDDEAALLALSDVDVWQSHRYPHGATPPLRSHQRRSNSRHAPHSRRNAALGNGGSAGAGGYRSDTGFPGPNNGNNNNRSFTGILPRRRAAGGWSKPSQRALEDAANYPGPVGRVGYVCVADELHLDKLEEYYRAQGYYTKFDFDVLHVRFAQPVSSGGVRVESSAATKSSHSGGDGGASNDDAGALTHRSAVNTSLDTATATTDLRGKEKIVQTVEEGQECLAKRNSPPRPLSCSQGIRTAADTSPTHRDYGTSCGLKTAVVALSGTEGGQAPAAAVTSAAAAANASAANTTSAKHGFELFIFQYGAVVWWGFDQRYFKIVENDYMLPHSAISHCMTNRYTTQLVNENYPVWCTYNLVRRDTLEVDDDFKARLRFDHFVIPYSRGDVATGSVLMLCASHALAQSAKIDYIELQVQGLADSCSPLPRELREKGTVSITERRLLQLRGEVLSYRLMLKSGSDLLDEPDFFWENAYLKPVFQATKEEFEIAERVETLDNKLDAANEILSMLAEDFSQRHGARLEWIVIWLVFVEVVIGVLELLVDVRPWLRSK